MSNSPLRPLLKEKGLRLADLAALTGVNKSTVTRWAQRKTPAERVLEIERVTGVSRHELRPDIYPVDAEACPQ